MDFRVEPRFELSLDREEMLVGRALAGVIKPGTDEAKQAKDLNVRIQQVRATVAGEDLKVQEGALVRAIEALAAEGKKTEG